MPCHEKCHHGRIKYFCKACKGQGICKHNKIKNRCKTCHGGALCKMPWCHTQSSKKYKGFCAKCSWMIDDIIWGKKFNLNKYLDETIWGIDDEFIDSIGDLI